MPLAAAPTSSKQGHGPLSTNTCEPPVCIACLLSPPPWQRCLAAGKRFFKVNEPHAVYFHNPKGLSTRPDGAGRRESTLINRRIEEPCGFHLENSAALLRWNTASRRAEFRASRLPNSILPECTSHAEQMVGEPVLLLQSLRSHDQYNTTIYGMDDRYRGIKGRRNVVFMNGVDARRLGFAEGDRVDMAAICNDGRERIVTGFNVVIYEIPQGNIAAYYPETNPLVPIDSIGEGSFTPTSKSIPVLVTASRQQENLLLSK